ncbi:MAG: hypothetical protein DCF25_05690 [Leptolyngbya foveolarum]|uniref:Ycf66 family protein n=1 Tax=Leptolyngbya foveolarum TaxID=47253 RepID=A0A2W4UNS6_9CYAN|nr:MAG: hypothetical protein DCF25_05690 [Leptolyngbya foveolarum]
MFAHVLAVLLGLGSLVFYLAAFFYPEVHRRSDFLWGGLGLLYSAVLWFGAGQMTGLVLLGQMVAVALLLGLGWQTLTVRRQKTPVYQQTPIVLTPEVVGGWAKSKLNELRIVPDENVRPVRLERRAVEGSAGLNARLDPRRRPAYDYEFVEDGVALAEVQQGELFSTAFVEEATGLSADIDEAVADWAYSAPPSAEAEVVAVESATEKDVPQEDLSEALMSEELVLEAGSAEEFIAEELIFEEAVSEDFTAEEAIADEVDSTSVEPESEFESSFVELGSEGLQTRVDDRAIAHKTHETQWSDQVPVAASQPKSLSTVTAGKKPSLLAMPMILVGWVKDVVVSLTKPKPAKPMIEIPRRDASVSNASVGNRPIRDADVNPSAEGDSRYNDDLEDDDWEDSNWAD